MAMLSHTLLPVNPLNRTIDRHLPWYYRAFT